jgi:hypothetical protein
MAAGAGPIDARDRAGAGGGDVRAGGGPGLEPAPGRIEIVLSGGVRVRIEGAVDPAAVTAAMAAVMKARRRR